MKKLILVGLLCFVLALAGGSLSAQDDLISETWNEIAPGGETICSRGTPYSFFVRPADPEKLMIHFQGGGACWNSFFCAAGSMQTFDDSVVAEQDLEYLTEGLFDYDNPENPVSDYTSVLVPYCTGDIHTGNAEVDYGNDVVIQHRGAVNANAVLDWVYENYPDPSQVFVNGCSAGAYGAIFHAYRIAQNYPDAQFTVLGDAGVGVVQEGWMGFVDWGLFEHLGDYMPSLADVAPEDFTTSLLYESTAEALPEAFLAQYTTAADEVQIAFFNLQGGLPENWSPRARAELDRLGELPNFASYTAAGDVHCIIPLAELYEYEVDGLRLVDWIAALVAGEAVESVVAAE